MTKYQADIGIETHVQLKTKSKLFCGCDNDARGKRPNSVVCPVCTGFPGTLPVLNHQAIRLALRLGLALNGKIPQQTKFDRKNYVYPDLPKGYQISQYDQPIVGTGSLEVPLEEKTIKVGITRAHLEEDAGKLTHPAGSDFSFVDLNRAGTPLVEIVSEPDLHSPAEAKAYVQELYNLVRYADVSDADLYHGNMRFDVNVSLRPAGSNKLGTRSETKNLNSFRSVERAVEFEIKRQTDLLETGGRVVQETRGFDESKGKTFSQRSKEEAHDYRYFPEPDLPPIVVTADMTSEAKASLPALPGVIRQQMLTSGLANRTAEVIISNLDLIDRYLPVVKKVKDPQGVANLLIEIGKIERDQPGLKLAVGDVAEVHQMLKDQEISSTAAKEVIRNLKPGQSPRTVAKKLKLLQVSDTAELEKLVAETIKAHPKPVQDFQNGQAQALGFLVGQVMKASRGQANPAMVNDILKKQLSS